MVDLIDYWLSLESSVSEDHDRNFKYAVWRATKEASKFLVGIFQDRIHEVSVDGADAYDEEHGSLWDRIVDTAAGPEEQACDTDEFGRARRLIEEVDTGEIDNWLGDYLAGITEEASAFDAGIHQSSMHRRREAGLRRIAAAACFYGLR